MVLVIAPVDFFGNFCELLTINPKTACLIHDQGSEIIHVKQSVKECHLLGRDIKQWVPSTLKIPSRGWNTFESGDILVNDEMTIAHRDQKPQTAV